MLYSARGSQEIRHASNFPQTCRSSTEGSVEDILDSMDLASTNLPDIVSKIASSLAIRDPNSFAPAILS